MLPKSLKHSRLIAAAVLFQLVLATHPALALEARTFMTKLNDAMALESRRIDYTAAEADGDKVVASGVTYVHPDGKVEIGQVTFEGVAETADGGYFVPHVTVEPFVMNEDVLPIRIGKPEIFGLRIPGQASSDSLGGFLLEGRIVTGPVEAGNDGFGSIRMTQFELLTVLAPDNSSVSLEAVSHGLAFEQPKDPSKRFLAAWKTFSSLGIERLGGRIHGKLVWSAAERDLTLEDASLAIDDLGELSMAIGLSDYSLSANADMISYNEAYSASGAKDPSAPEAPALPQSVKNIGLRFLEIRYEDNSLTDRMLAHYGQSQGVTGDELRVALKSMLPLMVKSPDMPELSDNLRQAMSAYLDDPRSFSIRSEPDVPIRLSEIDKVKKQPQDVARLLDLHAKANDQDGR